MEDEEAYYATDARIRMRRQEVEELEDKNVVVEDDEENDSDEVCGEEFATGDLAHW